MRKLTAIMAMGGMFLAAEGGAGGGANNPPSPPVPPLPPRSTVQEPDWRKEAEAARARAAELEARMKAKDEERLTLEQSLKKEVQDLNAFNAKQRADYEEGQRTQAARARHAELVAYRAELLRQFGNRIPVEMHGQVYGQDENQIYQTALQTAQAVEKLTADVENSVRQRLFPQGVPQQGQPPVGIPQGGIQQVPQNPHYVQNQQVQNGGFPRPVNPSVPQVQELDVSEFSSEQAVRSGKYLSAREKIMQSLKNGMVPQIEPQNQGQQQQAPQGIPQQQIPGGATRPAPAPMGTQFSSPQQAAMGQQSYPPPPQNGQQQFQQGVDQAQQGGGQQDFHAQAMAAIARTKAGQNPIAGQQGPGFEAQVKFAQQQAQQGVDPSQAFGNRFQNTPPIPGA